jgi:hypothetical protein
MLHTHRTWAVADVATADELAEKLTSMTWCLCVGFRLDGVLFLNDATSENGAQEYAVVRECDHRQIESVTFSWIDRPKAERIIRAAVADRLSQAGYGAVAPSRIEPIARHGRCRFCA